MDNKLIQQLMEADLFVSPTKVEIDKREIVRKERERAKLKDFPLGKLVKAYRRGFEDDEQAKVVETEVNWAGNPLVNVEFPDGTRHWYHPDWLYGR